jgi:hypothetical protein
VRTLGVKSVICRIFRLSVLLQCTLLTVKPLAAQDLPAPDPRSGELALVTRTLWRSMTLTDAVSVNAQVALPLLGSPGLLEGVQLEIRSWNALEDRARFRFADQYAATARYLHRIGDTSRTQYLSVAYTEYWNPKAPLAAPRDSRWNGEVALSAALETSFPSAGVPAIHFYGDLAHEFQRSHATYARLGASHTVGAGTIAATVALSVSASDYPSRLFATQLAEADFGFHSADGDLGIRYSWPRSRLSSYALKTALTAGGSLRGARLGPKVGWVEIRQIIQIF